MRIGRRTEDEGRRTEDGGDLTIRYVPVITYIVVVVEQWVEPPTATSRFPYFTKHPTTLDREGGKGLLVSTNHASQTAMGHGAMKHSRPFQM